MEHAIDLDLKVSTRVHLTIGFQIGGTAMTVEIKSETPSLDAGELRFRAEGLAKVIGAALQNFVRPAGAPYQPLEKLL